VSVPCSTRCFNRPVRTGCGSGLVCTLLPQREFRWSGTLLFARLFQGEHFFLLEPVSPQSTRLVHGESYTGLLVPLLRRQLERPTLQGFHAMNEALKIEAEQS
jgi:hypothetical protein